MDVSKRTAGHQGRKGEAGPGLRGERHWSLPRLCGRTAGTVSLFQGGMGLGTGPCLGTRCPRTSHLCAPESTELSCHRRCDKAARWWIPNTDRHGCVVAGSGVGVAGPPGGGGHLCRRCQHRRAFLPQQLRPSRHRLSRTAAGGAARVPLSLSAWSAFPMADCVLRSATCGCRERRGLGLALQLDHPRGHSALGHRTVECQTRGRRTHTLLSPERPRLPRGPVGWPNVDREPVDVAAASSLHLEFGLKCLRLAPETD